MHILESDPTRLTIAIEDEAATAALGVLVAGVVRPGDVVGLVGTLGAGKTRLSRAIAEALGVDPGVIASPTFVLIHEYDGDSYPVYHFDAYRLEGPAAFDALGAADYWTDATGICLIEWADLVADRLPDATWWVRIEAAADPAGRTVEVRHPDPGRLGRLAAAVAGPGAR